MSWTEEMGLEPHEGLAAKIAYAVWISIDWAAPLWKSAGYDVYGRFESRVRAAARESTVKGFANKLARKCHVAVPQISEALFKNLSSGPADELVLNFARKQSGLLVAAMRAHKENVKPKEGGAS